MLRVMVAEKGGAEREQFFDVVEVTIGRVQGNLVVLPKPNVSKRHATVTLQEGAVTLVDLKSTNGTYVNGRRISGPRQLSPEDRVYIGDFTLRFSVAEATMGMVEPTPIPPPLPEAEEPLHRATVSMSAFSPEDSPPLPEDSPPLPEEASASVPAPLEFDVEVEPVPPPPAAATVVTNAAGREPSAASPRPDSVEVGMGSRAAPLTDRSTVPIPHQASGEASGVRSQLSAIGRRGGAGHGDRGAFGRWLDALELVANEATHTVFANWPEEPQEVPDAEWQRLSDGVMRLVDGLRREKRLPADVDPFLLTQDVLYEFTGLGPLEELLADEKVRTIVVDGLDSIWVGRGDGLAPVVKAFATEQTQARVLARLADLAGVPQADLHRPVVTGRLPDGTSLRVVNPPVSAGARLVVLERPFPTTLTLDDLASAGVLEPDQARVLGEAVAARRGVLICGGSRERRVGVVDALLRALPEGERAVVLDGPQGPSPRSDRAVLVDRCSLMALGPAAWGTLASLRPDCVVASDLEADDLPLLARLSLDGVGVIASTGCADLEHLPAHLSRMARLALPALDERGAAELAGQVVNEVALLASGEDGHSRVVRLAGWLELGLRVG